MRRQTSLMRVLTHLLTLFLRVVLSLLRMLLTIAQRHPVLVEIAAGIAWLWVIVDHQRALWSMWWQDALRPGLIQPRYLFWAFGMTSPWHALVVGLLPLGLAIALAWPIFKAVQRLSLFRPKPAMFARDILVGLTASAFLPGLVRSTTLVAPTNPLHLLVQVGSSLVWLFASVLVAVAIEGDGHWFRPVAGAIRRRLHLPDRLFISQPAGRGALGSALWVAPTRVGLTRKFAPGSVVVAGQPGHLWFLPSQLTREHGVILSPTGGGKTSGIIVPTILAHGAHPIDHTTPHLIITDPKGELVALTKSYMEAAGWHSYVIAPGDARMSYGYDPVRSWLHDDAGELDFLAIQDLAQVIVPSSGDPKADYFEANARMLVAGILSVIAQSGRGIPDVVETLTTLDDAALAELLMEHPIAQRTAGILIKRLAATSNSASTLANIISELPEKLKPWLLPSVAGLLDPARPRLAWRPILSNPNVHPTITYLVGLKATSPVLAACLSELIAAVRYIGQERGRLPRPALVLADELGNMPPLPNLDEVVSLYRGWGFGFFGIIQSRAQLVATYGPDKAKTLWANMKTRIVLPGVSREDATEISQDLGQTTVTVKAPGLQRNIQTHFQARSLISPDEIRTINDPKHPRIIVYRSTTRAANLPQYGYYSDPQWQAIAATGADDRRMIDALAAQRPFQPPGRIRLDPEGVSPTPASNQARPKQPAKDPRNSEPDPFDPLDPFSLEP